MGIAVKKNEELKGARAENPVWTDTEEFPSTPFDYTYDKEGYLTSDGQPVAEYDINLQQMTNSILSLKVWYGDRAVYVGANNYIHYKKGDFNRHVSPDCYVVFGVPNGLRENYKSWENGGKIPAIVFEFTSKKTAIEDQDKKFEIYEQFLRVPEYILFDPNGDYLRPPFQGWRLDEAGNYQRIPLENGRLYSEQLDMFMEIRSGDIRFIDAKTGASLRTPAEEAQQRVQEKARADYEERARQQAELRAEQETQRAEQETQRAEQEALRAEQEIQARQQAEIRVSEETRLRLEAEARTAALLAELAALRGNSSA